jgi:hypothetical protein
MKQNNFDACHHQIQRHMIYIKYETNHVLSSKYNLTLLNSNQSQIKFEWKSKDSSKQNL